MDEKFAKSLEVAVTWNYTYKWFAAQNRENHKDTKVVYPLCGHTTFVQPTQALTVNRIDKITTFCNYVNKTITLSDWHQPLPSITKV